ncbi:MAG TPA: Lsr2 family protein [Candidatus Saccharimonadales bacterium]|nr:Lsr2 family protein [Candidatus Saccharimonadales bacterium]
MPMAQTIVIKLVDDIDGGDADETLEFGLDGKTYEIELSKKNAAALRKALAPYVDKSRLAGRQPALGRGRVSVRQARGSGTRTLFSELGAEENERFRGWANMPTARRIGDSKVQDWIDAGRP